MKTSSLLSSLAALSLLASLVACGASDEGASGSGPGAGKVTIDPKVGGKSDADGPAAFEAGRFLEDGARQGTFDGTALPAYRIASFGNTKVRVTLQAESFDPVLLVDGPYPGSNPQVLANNDDAGPDDANSKLELTLEAAGTYRLIVGSYETFQDLPVEAGDYTISFTCVEGCTPPQMSLAEFLERVKEDGGPELVEKLLVEKTSGLFEDPQMAATVRAQAEALLTGAGKTDAFPVIPLSAVPMAQGYLEQAVEAEETEPPSPVEFDLENLLDAACKPDRGEATVLVPELPDLRRGYASDHRFDDCSLLHTQQLAEVLNNLSLDNGSAVVAGADRYETVEAAIRALVASGHTIEARNNRYYANFLGLEYKGIPVAAPLWIDTGIKLPSGDNMLVPAPHSHYHFVIDGPLIRGEIMFYMGIPGGVGFRANHAHRPSWTGERTSIRRNSEDHLETVVSLFVTAGKLRKKWVAEGAGLPVEGYGQLGVCMDSTAILEFATEKSVTLYPLLHPALTGPAGDEIDTLLSSMPTDLDGSGSSTALDRLLASQPFDVSQGVDLEEMPFPTLKTQIEGVGR